MEHSDCEMNNNTLKMSNLCLCCLVLMINKEFLGLPYTMYCRHNVSILLVSSIPVHYLVLMNG